MKNMEISPDHEKLLAIVRPFTLPWRKMTIAVDGVDGSGKSTLARFLAWQLGMPAIETDTMIPAGAVEPKPDPALLNRLISSRHEGDRPLIVEGVFVLRSLNELGINPDFLVRVEASGIDGSYTWEKQLNDYSKDYPRANSPDFLFSWVPSENG